MKTGVSSYSFNRLIKTGSFTIFDAVEYAAKTGFDAIEFTDIELPQNEAAPDYVKKLRESCEKAGLAISCYAVQADFLYGSGGDTRKEVLRLKSCVDTAYLLGAPALRHDFCWGLKDGAKARNWREAVELAKGAVLELTEYAAEKGVKTMTENHGYFLQDSSRMEALVLAVNHPNYGLLADIGNFMCADETSSLALANVMPYAFHVHVKDFLWKSGAEARPDDSWFATRAGNHLRGTILGHGSVSVSQCLEVIKKSGYSGAVSLEFEGPEENLDAIRRGFEFLKANLK